MLKQALKIVECESFVESEEEKYEEQKKFMEKPLHPSIKLGDAIKQLEQILRDMKGHLTWEQKVETKEMKPEHRSAHEHELLYYENQIDSMEATIKQLKALAMKGKVETIKEDHNDMTKYIVKNGKTFVVDRTDIDTGKRLVKPGDVVSFKHKGKTLQARVTDRALGRDDVYEVELLEGFKVDDIVIPNVGPHKGIKHNVVDVFEDGSLTIEPVGLLKKNVRYVNGIVVAAPEQVRKIDESKDAFVFTVKDGSKVVGTLTLSGIEASDYNIDGNLGARGWEVQLKSLPAKLKKSIK